MNKIMMVGMSLMLATVTALMAESKTAESKAEYGVDYKCGQYGYGMMGGQGMMGGYGMMGNQGMMGQNYGTQRGYEPIPEAKAKKMIEQYLKDNLKGFEITKMESQRMPMGLAYWATVKDKNGNEFELHLNPWGYISGPFVR